MTAKIQEIKLTPHQKWGLWYLNLFGLTHAGGRAMVLEWADLFEWEGRPVEELTAAGKWLAINEPPQYPSEHLAALKRRLDAQKKQDSKFEDTDRGTCTTCKGTGIAIVPGYGCKTAGGHEIPSDSMATVAVMCSCALGRWFAQNQSGTTRMETLERYAMAHPGWKDQMDRINAVMKKRAAVAATTSGMDRLLGAIFQRLQIKADARDHQEDADERDTGTGSVADHCEAN